jgi:YfiH family protein
MVRDEAGGLPLLRFRRLSAMTGLHHAVFTRSGGVSTGPHAALNVAFGVGDDPARVRRNRRRVRRAMDGLAPVFLRQNHGTRILALGPETGVAAPEDAGEPLTGDAAATSAPGRLLVIQVADCQAIVFFDPVRRVVANVHSGWRGSVANIAGRTVAFLQRRFGCRPEDLSVGIGPSLGPCCAEFINYRREIPPPLWRYRVGAHHFDFWTMSVDQLQAAGVPPGAVEVAGLCTRCRTDLFFSYRGEQTTGRFAVVAGLAPEKRET